jgi:hypothetical protein
MTGPNGIKDRSDAIEVAWCCGGLIQNAFVVVEINWRHGSCGQGRLCMFRVIGVDELSGSPTGGFEPAPWK